MAFKFRHALFAAGLFLVFLGVASLMVDILTVRSDPGDVEALSRGFDTIFLSLFSGVLMGIGIGLVCNGFVLHTLGNKRHIIISALFSVLFLALAAFAVFLRGITALYTLVAFFAFISASATCLFTSLWYGLSSVAKKYVHGMK
ncbi:MAG: hypothetical protein WC717_02705 [Candidatus Micrarchaeia archaeon]|jgi:hypothetical protein